MSELTRWSFTRLLTEYKINLWLQIQFTSLSLGIIR